METAYKIYSETQKKNNAYVSWKKVVETDLEKLKLETVSWVHVFCEVINGGLL
jgi:hypothetical protein